MGLLKSETDYFGIDIGTTSIRVVQLKHGGGKPSLVAYGDVKVAGGITTSDSADDRIKVAEIIKQLLRDTHISTKNVVAGLSTTKVFASVITTPKLSSAELAKSIKYQAEHYVPMAVDQAKLDWTVIGPGKTEHEQEVLLVGAPKSTTEKYLEICQNAGIELLALEPNPIALSRAVLSPGNIAVLILDIGSLNSDITIVRNNIPVLMRSITVGGNVFVRAVSQNLGLDAVQAEQFTHKFGLTQSKLEGQVYKAIKSGLDTLLVEIEKSIKFFTDQNPTEKLEKIVLTGGTAALPELPAYLATATNLPVEIANAWVNVSYPAKLQDQLIGLSSGYGVAVGLAERMLL